MSDPREESGTPASWMGETVNNARNDDLEPGSEFAQRYVIEKRIGKGGMGTVYKALDKMLEVPVAVKTINRNITDNERTILRLKREVILARKVAHPNACRIYDIGQTAGQHYVSMEYLEGRTLADILDEDGPFNAAAGISILKQLLPALQEAHRVGIIHRDLKPQNIMIDVHGRACIMDFGISVSDEVQRLTKTGMVIGTPRYMAPEQFSDRNVDQRSDIYAMGIIMFEMFTGRLPFDADTPAAVMYAHLHGPLLRPAQVVVEISPDLENVIVKSMERDPQKRFHKVSEIYQELVKIEETVYAPTAISPKVPPLPTVETLVQPAIASSTKSRSPFAWIVAASLLALAVIGLGIFLIKKSDQPHQVTEIEADQSIPAAPSEEPQHIEDAGIAGEQQAEPEQQAPMETATLGETPVDTAPPENQPLTEADMVQKEQPIEKTAPARDPAPQQIKPSVERSSIEPNRNLVEPAVGTVIFENPFPVKIFNGKNLLMDTSITRSVSLKPGTYQLLLVGNQGAFLPGYSQKVEVVATRQTLIPPPAVGYLSIRSNPGDCNVTIDETYRAVAPVLNLPVQTGKHRILFEWPSLQAEEEVTIEIVEKQTTRLRGTVTDESIAIVEE